MNLRELTQVARAWVVAVAAVVGVERIFSGSAVSLFEVWVWIVETRAKYLSPPLKKADSVGNP